jgi:hypothetical protein
MYEGGSDLAWYFDRSLSVDVFHVSQSSWGTKRNYRVCEKWHWSTSLILRNSKNSRSNFNLRHNIVTVAIYINVLRGPQSVDVIVIGKATVLNLPLHNQIKKYCFLERCYLLLHVMHIHFSRFLTYSCHFACMAFRLKCQTSRARIHEQILLLAKTLSYNTSQFQYLSPQQKSQ